MQTCIAACRLRDHCSVMADLQRRNCILCWQMGQELQCRRFFWRKWPTFCRCSQQTRSWKSRSEPTMPRTPKNSQFGNLPFPFELVVLWIILQVQLGSTCLQRSTRDRWRRYRLTPTAAVKGLENARISLLTNEKKLHLSLIAPAWFCMLLGCMRYLWFWQK